MFFPMRAAGGGSRRTGNGGRGGIRTHGGRQPTAVFKTAALNHSATRPAVMSLAAGLTILQTLLASMVTGSGGWGAVEARWRAGQSCGWVGAVAVGLALSGCATVGRRTSNLSPPDGGTMRPYEVRGVWYTPRDQPGYDAVGLATWYGFEAPNRRTADGERFDAEAPLGRAQNLAAALPGRGHQPGKPADACGCASTIAARSSRVG